MATIYVDNRATGGAQDGTSAADAFLHPDDITGVVAGSIIEFVEGSGPYYQAAVHPLGNNGTAANPIIWRGNGCEWTCGLELNSVAGGEWHLSAGGTNEYYFTAASGANPSLATPDSATVDGHHYEQSSEDDNYQRGTVGSLTDGQLGFGDGDTLGFNTVYARFDDLSPTTHEVTVAQSNGIAYTTWQYHQFEDFIFSYCNAYALRNNSITPWTMERCVVKYCDDGAFSTENGGGITVTSCVGFFTGHRFAVATNGALNLYNNISIKSHIFALSSATNANTHNIYNNIGYKLTSGFMDVGGAAAACTVNEDFNFIYADWPTGTTATSLDYSAGASTVWTTTGASSIPAAANTDISTLAALVAAGSFEPTFNVSFTDFDSITGTQLRGLKVSGSTMTRLGTKWWTGAAPIGINEEPFQSIKPDLGINQTFSDPFHPANL